MPRLFFGSRNSAEGVGAFHLLFTPAGEYFRDGYAVTVRMMPRGIWSLKIWSWKKFCAVECRVHPEFGGRCIRRNSGFSSHGVFELPKTEVLRLLLRDQYFYFGTTKERMHPERGGLGAGVHRRWRQRSKNMHTMVMHEWGDGDLGGLSRLAGNDRSGVARTNASGWYVRWPSELKN